MVPILKEFFDKENSNLIKNAETLHKRVADKVLKEYFLNEVLDDIKDYHIQGYLHFHQLEYFYRPNCCQHDLRPFYLEGLKVDGSGNYTSVSGPARRPIVAVQHAAKVMMAAQTNMAGGQSIDYFNYLIAPYFQDLSTREAYQALEMFFYELNQMYVSRGGQVIFSNINISSEPGPLAEENIIYKGEYHEKTYQDFQETAEKINRIILSLLLRGDYRRLPFLFPIVIYKVWNMDDLEIPLDSLILRNANINFLMMNPEIENINYMGCRTRLAGKFKDTIRTGNLCYTTVNLPLIALETKDLNDFLDRFKFLAKITREFLNRKRKFIEENKDLLPFLFQELDGEIYYNLEKTTESIGIIGLVQALKFLDLDSDIANLVYLSRKFNKIAAKYGLKLLASPAEGVSQRFLEILKQKGVKLNYLLNSYFYHEETISEQEKIILYSRLAKYYNAGNIIHCFLYKGDITGYPRKLLSLAYSLGAEYISLSNITNYCPTCKKFYPGRCIYGHETIGLAKITGYLSNTENWNHNKIEELKYRYY